MSRSRRKSPFMGMTTAESDKVFKKIEHRRARRKLSATNLLDEEPPHPKEYGDPWNSHKDGKQMFDPAEYPKGVRK